MKLFAKGLPLKKDGFYLTVNYMFGDGDAFQTVSERVDTEYELYNLNNLVTLLTDYLNERVHYDEIEWPVLLEILGVSEEEFDNKFYAWLATDNGFFLGHVTSLVLSMVEGGIEYELGVGE